MALHDCSKRCFRQTRTVAHVFLRAMQEDLQVPNDVEKTYQVRVQQEPRFQVPLLHVRVQTKIHLNRPRSY